MSTRRGHILDIATILILLGVIALSRAYAYHEPADWDTGTYAAIGHELALGGSLYSDAWDVKPPGILVSFAIAEKIAGYGYGQIYLLSTVSACVLMLGIFFLAKTMGRTAAIVAAAAYAITGGDLYLWADRANTEVFINACIVWAAVLMLRFEARRAWLRIVGIGLLLALATLYKQVAIAPSVALIVAYIAIPPASISRRNALIHAAAIFGVIAGVWLLTFGYFAASGRGELFWITTFVYPRFYGGNLLGNLVSSLHPEHLFPKVLFPLLPAALLTLAAVVSTRGRPLAILVALIFGAWLGVAMLQKFSDHYYQLWYPGLCVGAGMGAMQLAQHLKLRWIGCTAIGVSLGCMIWIQVPRYFMSPMQWSNEKNGFLHTMSQRVGTDLGQMLGPDERFFDWSENNTWLYFAARRRPVGPGLWRSHMREGPMAQILTTRTLERLKRDPPSIVVVWAANSMQEDHPITQWIDQNYVPVEDGVSRWPLQLMRKK